MTELLELIVLFFGRELLVFVLFLLLCLRSMAQGVDGAAVVCCFMTKDYSVSDTHLSGWFLIN